MRAEGRSGLTRQFCGVSHFLRDFRTLLRFGHLSRSALHLSRLLIKEEVAECDWIARKQDAWDADLSRELGRRHASLQALKDAIEIRALIFERLPRLRTARLRVYREADTQPRELIIVGTVRRDDRAYRGVHSLAMRAKLIGFRFDMEDGFLRRLPREERFGYSD